MPVLSSRINAVIDLIGPDRPTDYVIEPASHASQYAKEAPELARLLRASEVQVAAELYEDLDGSAIEAQQRFVRASNHARNAVFLAGMAGAMLLAAASLSPLLGDAVTKALIILATIVGIIAGGLGAMWLHSIRSGALLERWMKRRAEAEMERLRYFDLVARERELEEPLLQLEYFRRYQLDVQRAFFRKRGKEHAAAADRTLTIGTAAMAVGGIITALAGAFAASLEFYWASIAGLALVAQAIAAHAENREATAQHRRNAERYERTRHGLDRLAGMLDGVRAATADGDLAVMQEFVASVHDQLSLEHRQWIEEMGEASEAINRLQGLLEQYRAKAEETSPERRPFLRVDEVLPPRRDGAGPGDGAGSPPAMPVPAEATLPREAAGFEDESDFENDGHFAHDPDPDVEEPSGEPDPRGQ